MTLRVETGLSAPQNFIEDVFYIDRTVYKPELCGKIENLYKRHNFCPDSFILIYDEDTLAGYMNLFPISDTLYDQLNSPSFFKMRDDDIEPHEMENWSKDKPNNLFIISIAIMPSYRNGEAIKLLGSACLSFLREKDKEGYKIGSISGSAISIGGENFLKRLRGVFVKELEEGYRYYFTDNENARSLIENGLLL